MTSSEKCARAFANLHKTEARRAQACLDDIFNLLIKAEVDWTTGESQIMARLMAYYSRDGMLSEPIERVLLDPSVQAGIAAEDDNANPVQ